MWRKPSLDMKNPFVSYPMDDLLDMGATEKQARREIIRAVCAGLIEHDGDPLRGVLTIAGRKLLKSG